MGKSDKRLQLAIDCALEAGWTLGKGNRRNHLTTAPDSSSDPIPRVIGGHALKLAMDAVAG